MSIKELTILGLLALGTGGWPGGARAQAPSRIDLVFRYDDFSSRSPVDLETRIFRLFAERKMPLTVGIIPFIVGGSEDDDRPQPLLALSEEKFRLLQAGLTSGFLEPALHGYSHQTNRSEGPGGPSEFLGLRYDEQFRRIAEGKRFLEARLGKTLDIFIPPWDLYDENTVRCLEKLGFHILSDQLSGRSIPSASLSFLPETATLSSLAESIQGARQAAPDHSLVVVLIHPDDFAAAEGKPGHTSLAGLTGLLDWVLQQRDIHPASMGELASQKTFDFARRAANIAYMRERSLIPAPVSRRLNLGWGAAFSTEYFSRIRFKLWFYLAAGGLIVLGFAGLVAFLLGSFFLAGRPLLARQVLLLVLALVVVAVLSILSNLTLTDRKFLLLLLSLGILGGLGAARRRIESRRRRA